MSGGLDSIATNCSAPIVAIAVAVAVAIAVAIAVTIGIRVTVSLVLHAGATDSAITLFAFTVKARAFADTFAMTGTIYGLTWVDRLFVGAGGKTNQHADYEESVHRFLTSISKSRRVNVYPHSQNPGISTRRNVQLQTRKNR